MGPIGVGLVHGTRASRTMWLRQLEALAQARVPAVAPDLPGHGRRAGEPFTLDGAVAAVEEAAASLAGDVVVAGLSLGGYLALHWAARTERPVAAGVAAGRTARPRDPGLAAYRRLAAPIGPAPGGGRRLHAPLVRLMLPEPARPAPAAPGWRLTAGWPRSSDGRPAAAAGSTTRSCVSCCPTGRGATCTPGGWSSG